MSDTTFQWGIIVVTLVAIAWTVVSIIFRIIPHMLVLPSAAWGVISGLVLWAILGGLLLHLWGRSYMSKMR